MNISICKMFFYYRVKWKHVCKYFLSESIHMFFDKEPASEVITTCIAPHIISSSLLHGNTYNISPEIFSLYFMDFCTRFANTYFFKKYIKYLFTSSFTSTTNHVIHCLLDQPTDWLGWDILDCQSKDLDWIYYRVLMLPPLLFPCWSDDLFQYLPDVLSPNCVIMFSYQLNCD